MTQIPIFRAKKIDSDEYVVGYYLPAYEIYHYILTHLGVDTKTSTVYTMSTDLYKIDPSTLSINFPDMLDSQGNKIFASLSEDGKGGDICENESFPNFKDLNGTCVFYKGRYTILKNGVTPKFELSKIIGIQQ